LVPAICDPRSSAEEGIACQLARPFASVVSTNPVVAPLGIIIFPFICRVELLVKKFEPLNIESWKFDERIVALLIVPLFIPVIACQVASPFASEVRTNPVLAPF
jgi:hypothetical protein